MPPTFGDGHDVIYMVQRPCFARESSRLGIDGNEILAG